MKLYQFQETYLDNLPAKYIFSAETGTGKTVMALEHYRRKAYPKKLLILGPAAKMRTGDWQEHVKMIFGDEAPEVHYYSYEKYSRNSLAKEYRKSGSKGVWWDWIGQHQNEPFALICDEVHRAANPQSGIGKAVYQTVQIASFFVGLSATPLPNGWISAANYFKMFGYTRNITEFKNRYCKIQTFKGFPEIVGYHREDEIREFWNRISKPLKKEDALDLPSIVTIPVSFDTPSLYWKIHKERVFDGKFLDNASALLHALRQATIEPKIPWLDEFIDGASSNIVIFYTYVSERNAILDLIKKKHKGRVVFRQDGERHEVPPKSEWGHLQRTITLAQYQSGSTGIEMSYADTIVFFSPQYSYTQYHQAVGRIERIGQKAKMALYKLCCTKTVERDIWIAIKNKTDFQETVWYSQVNDLPF